MIPRAPLALFDLDNTLVDRAGAFRTWARGFVDSRGLSEGEVEWLETTDNDGLLARAVLFDQVRARYGLADGTEDLVAAYRRDYPRCVEPAGEQTRRALDALRTGGWKIGIVSNGPPTQEAKIAAAGLEDAVDGWAISEMVGARKPERAIFEAAARACGCPLSGAWVIGDSAGADIAGAVGCGLRSAWISRGRQWEMSDYVPDLIFENVPDAVQHIIRMS